jgi:SNF2 family DNA or RNA helicase
MFGSDTTKLITPKELKQIANDRYEKMYKDEVSKLEQLVIQLENIHKHKEKFNLNEYTQRFKHYEELINKQEKVVNANKNAYKYFHNASIQIIKVVEGKNIDSDDICAICMNPHESPITHLSKCGHYFCKSCIDTLQSQHYIRQDHNIICPLCRTLNTNNDIFIVSDKVEITYSPKIRKIINIITSSEDRFIIFTQFHKLIDNLIIILKRCGINVAKYSDYKNFSDNFSKTSLKVIILSSEENAAGIDLTEFNNVIVFEPFEDSTYCKEIYWQLVGRVHRHGQTKSVNVYRLIMMKTIEEIIYSKFI